MDHLDLDFVEWEATPRLLLKLSIQLHLAGLSLSNTVFILDIFGVKRARSTVHNWVHNADLQPEDGRSPDHITVDETVIQLNDEQYWLYAVVDTQTNEWLHTKLRPTTTTVFDHSFLTEFNEKHDVDDAVFLVNDSKSVQPACYQYGYDFEYEKQGSRNAAERISREVKRRIVCISNCFSSTEAETADDWLRSFSFAWKQLI
ncbi:IS6 family transposase [Haloarcula japonica]|uniref:IS6 family transposase n=1 Tax=Haloarcula japonica TaxID=29282 RepID=UPI0039F6C46C